MTLECGQVEDKVQTVVWSAYGEGSSGFGRGESGCSNCTVREQPGPKEVSLRPRLS